MALKTVAEVAEDQRHAGDILALAWDENKLYSGGEDCVIKAWDPDLKCGKPVATLGGAVVALAADKGSLWAAGMGSELRVWPPGQQESNLLLAGDGEFGVLLSQGGSFYAGDDQGNVNVFVNNKLQLRYNMIEEVKDLAIEDNRMYTVRDLDVTITECYPDSTRYMTLATLQGRAPLRILGDLILVIDRTGKNILIYRNSKPERFPALGEVKISELILTSLCIAKDGRIWTGGWDGVARKWKRDKDSLMADGKVDVGGCINAIVAGEGSRVFAAVAGGRVVALE